MENLGQLIKEYSDNMLQARKRVTELFKDQLCISDDMPLGCYIKEAYLSQTKVELTDEAREMVLRHLELSKDHQGDYLCEAQCEKDAEVKATYLYLIEQCQADIDQCNWLLEE